MKVIAPWTNEEFEVLSRERIEEILRSIDPEEVVKTAYAGYIPGMKAGYAAIDLVTGDLQTESLGQSEEQQGRDALWVAAYVIGPNPLERQTEDIYSPEEIEEYERSEEKEDGYGIDEYFDLSPAEMEEREVNALIHYYHDMRPYQPNVEEQLDHWYGKAGD